MTGSYHPLAGGAPPGWAVEWGDDNFGPFMAFAVAGVKQRLRWIPEGTFWMGSPADEERRYEDEGPRHLVTLKQGLWLAETPCTQDLWKAVMGSNPSRFVTGDRPVEQVSWEDCKRFLEKLNEKVAGLDARLPTEAEWERACRGGKETATWEGNLRIKGERNAPMLDPIAWYGGNSGHEIETDLENTYDSNQWPEKQYPHTRAATRRVKRKRPNPFGLYDMLGNVWEWCEDLYAAYPGGKPASDDWVGKHRVLRGGSWLDDARLVRAALRNAIPPSYADGNIGFRLARGPG